MNARKTKTAHTRKRSGNRVKEGTDHHRKRYPPALVIKSISHRIHYPTTTKYTCLFRTMIGSASPFFFPHTYPFKVFGRRNKKVSPAATEAKDNKTLQKKKNKTPRKPLSVRSTASDKTDTASCSSASYDTTGVWYNDIVREYARHTPYIYHSQVSAMPYEYAGL